MKKYEYKFVRIERTWFIHEPSEDYKKIIIEHGDEGWRLNQIFSPINANGSKFFILIFEKEVNK